MYSNSTKTHGYLAKLFRISNIYHSDIHCMYMPLYLYIQNINDKIKKKKAYQSDVRATISKAVNVMPQGHIAYMSNKDQLIKSFTKLNTMQEKAQI